MIIAFIELLITVRKVSSATISQYLFGIRLVHLNKQVMPRNLRPKIVKSIVKGHAQKEVGNKTPRLAMTFPVMTLLKKTLGLEQL